MAVVGARRYRFATDLTLSVRGPAGVLRHFDAEYGRALDAGPDPDAAAIGPQAGRREPGGNVMVSFAPVDPVRHGTRGVVDGCAAWTVLHGQHKGTRWDVLVGEQQHEPESGLGATAAAGPLVARIEVAGPFGLSLVQSRVIEPLLVVAAARAGVVLLSAAAFLVEGRLVALAGGPHTGKTSLAARAIAAGIPVISDDRILVGPDGSCLPFPRRPRAYWALRGAAPGFIRSLPLGLRIALGARAALSLVSGGSLDLPVLLPVRTLAARLAETAPRALAAGPPQVERLVVVERAPVPALERTPVEPAAAVESLVAIQASDQAALEGVRAQDAWSATLRCGLEAQRTALASAMGAVETELVRVPIAMPYIAALGALSRVVGLTG